MTLPLTAVLSGKSPTLTGCQFPHLPCGINSTHFPGLRMKRDNECGISFKICDAFQVLVTAMVMSFKRGGSWDWTLFKSLGFISASLYWAPAVCLALCSTLRGLKEKA